MKIKKSFLKVFIFIALVFDSTLNLLHEQIKSLFIPQVQPTGPVLMIPKLFQCSYMIQGIQVSMNTPVRKK